MAVGHGELPENLFLRKQLALYAERDRRPPPRPSDPATRFSLALLSRLFNWPEALLVVRPESLLRWHRQGWRLLRCRKSTCGRPPVPPKARRLSVPTSPQRLKPAFSALQRGKAGAELAEAAGTTQRAISYYETEAGFPPAPAVVALAEALGVTTDELLGLEAKRKPAQRAAVSAEDTETRRLWKKFQQVQHLPEKDQRAVIRLINSLAAHGQAEAG